MNHVLGNKRNSTCASNKSRGTSVNIDTRLWAGPNE